MIQEIKKMPYNALKDFLFNFMQTHSLTFEELSNSILEDVAPDEQIEVKLKLDAIYKKDIEKTTINKNLIQARNYLKTFGI